MYKHQQRREIAVSLEREVEIKEAMGRYLDYLINLSTDDIRSLNGYELLLMAQLSTEAEKRFGRK